MRRSVRCRHGFCLETVGCEQCGAKVLYGASSHLRRAHERRAIGARPQVINHGTQGGWNKKSRRAAEREKAAG